MKAGRLRHRVELQSATETADSYGEPTFTWSTYAHRWASVEPLQGRELFTAQQVNPEVNIRVRLRHDEVLADLTPKHRLVFGSRTLEIDSVIRPDERGREVQLLCKEAV